MSNSQFSAERNRRLDELEVATGKLRVLHELEEVLGDHVASLNIASIEISGSKTGGYVVLLFGHRAHGKPFADMVAKQLGLEFRNPAYVHELASYQATWKPHVTIAVR